MKLKRDDGSFVWIEYVVESHGCPSNCWDDPGEATLVSIVDATDEEGEEVALTKNETERLETEIGELLDSEPDDYDWDW